MFSTWSSNARISCLFGRLPLCAVWAHKTNYSTNMNTCLRGSFEPYVDPVFSVNTKFKACTKSSKVNLGIGVYKDENGKSYVLDVVKKVEQELASDKSQTKDYFNMDGLDSLITGTTKLVFGQNCPEVSNGQIQGVQTLSGTGAFRLAVEVLTRYYNVSCFYCPTPTWPVHVSLLEYLQIKDIRRYKYYSAEKNELAWNDVVSTLNSAPEYSAIVLHGCGHNPTGLDFTDDQWRIVAQILIERKLIPVLDFAYMGFVTGNIEMDSYPARLLRSLGKELFVCISFSKNLGLYNERAGVLCWMAAEKAISDQLRSALCYIIRNNYSNPPAHGAKVASRIINDQALSSEWQTELVKMSQRILSMRTGLYERLTNLKTPGDWSFVIKQRGLFSYTGLTKPQIRFLEEKYSIFTVDTGRINIASLTYHNLDYVASAIHDAVTNIPK